MDLTDDLGILGKHLREHLLNGAFHLPQGHQGV